MNPRAAVELFRLVEPTDAELFDTEAAGRILAEPLIQRFLSESPASGSPESELLTLFQALAVQRSSVRPRRQAELVMTVPGGSGLTVRRTWQVVREILEGVQRRLMVLGFDVREEFLGRLGRLSHRVELLLIIDRQQTDPGTLTQWCHSAGPNLRVYSNRERPGDAPFAKMHSKALIADGKDALITSANMTFHGFQGNFEIGVRLRDELAHEAAQNVDRLLRSDYFEELSI